MTSQWLKVSILYTFRTSGESIFIYIRASFPEVVGKIREVAIARSVYMYLQYLVSCRVLLEVQNGGNIESSVTVVILNNSNKWSTLSGINRQYYDRKTASLLSGAIYTNLHNYFHIFVSYTKCSFHWSCSGLHIAKWYLKYINGCSCRSLIFFTFI